MHAAAQVTLRVVKLPTRHRCHPKRVGNVRLRRGCAASESPGDAPVFHADSDTVRLVEFYSGSGMMRWALQNAVSRISPHRAVRGVGAIDNSQVANAVYSANFPCDECGPTQRNIEHLTIADLENTFGGAEVWTASPPCQPYTRKGNQKHGRDARSSSWTHVLSLFPQLSEPSKPARVLIENVVGFETSSVRDLTIETFERSGYDVREFVGVSPIEIGVPNTRPRYYLLAKKKKNGLGFVDKKKPFCECADGESSLHSGNNRKPVLAYLEKEIRMHPDAHASLLVPFHLTEKYWRFFDVVTPESLWCQCFTAGYGKTHFGGSVLAHAGFVENEQTSDQFLELVDSNAKRYKLKRPPPHGVLRYFAPREIANMHGVTETFALPPTLTTRQLYHTLGNSISVQVVETLMAYLMEDETTGN